MATNKKSALLHCDIIHTVEKLTDEQAGKLFKHYLRYVNDLNPKGDVFTEIVFEPIRQNLKRDLVKWADRADKSRENGKLGGRPRLKNNLENPAGLKKPVKVKVKDNVKDNVKDIKSTNSMSGDEVFNSFWELYPKKIGKGGARKAWNKIKNPKATLEKIAKSLVWQKQSEQWKKENGQFIPHPSTYLNNERWEDEPTRRKLPNPFTQNA